MKAKVNKQLLKTTRFDSGSLGMLAMVLRQFPSSGYYRSAILEQGHSVAEVDFVVDEKSEVMQLDIDLAQIIRNAKARPESCGCARERQTTRVVSPRGYVLFHATSGDGYSATVSNEGGKEVFDTTKLGDGNLFAVSLLEPGEYSMTNTMGSAVGEIVVSLTPEMTKQIKTLETLYVDVSAGKFDPARIELTSTQGLVFRIKETARILIEKKYDSRSERVKPIIRWRKLRAVKR